MSLRRRNARREARSRMRALAWVFLASPILVVLFGKGRYSVYEAALMPVVGVAMLLWFRRRPLRWPEHLASVAYTSRLDDYHGPDALPPGSFYLAWCDCGWLGAEDHADAESAAREAREHTPHVRPGLHELLKE